MNALSRLSNTALNSRIWVSFLMALIWLLIVGVSVSEVSAMPQLVISGVSAGVTKADEEYIQLANIGDQEVDVTDLQVIYQRRVGDPQITKISFDKLDNYTYSILPGERALFVSNSSFSAKLSDDPNFLPDGLLKSSSSSLVSTGGILTLVDSFGDVLDDVYWGDTATELVVGFPALTNGRALVLNDKNQLEFSASVPFPVQFGGLNMYEIQFDVCPNIDGMQLVMPTDSDYDDNNNCVLLSTDLCFNIERIQQIVPEGYLRTAGSDCFDASLDICQNLDGLQTEVPTGYRLVDDECRPMPSLQALRINEVLPNVSGVDTGREFIELYHAGSEELDLSDYKLKIGKNAEKTFALDHQIIKPGQYVVLYDSELGFSLLNSTTRLELYFYDDRLVSQIIPYQSPQDDMAWAYIDDVWQYTNIVTPGSANVAVVESSLGISPLAKQAELGPCPQGKYRHPLTNRCRNIESDASVLVACGADEYRNPDTNRCRKILQATSSLAPCLPGYERNPATNRCRKVVTATASLTPCKDGYERNPATNRCRKVVVPTSQPETSLLDEINQPQSLSSLTNPYYLVAMAGVGATGYAVYEWRTELTKLSGRVIRFLRRK